MDDAHALGLWVRRSRCERARVNSLPDHMDVWKVRSEERVEAVVADDRVTPSHIAPPPHQTGGSGIVLHLDSHVVGIALRFHRGHAHVAAEELDRNPLAEAVKPGRVELATQKAVPEVEVDEVVLADRPCNCPQVAEAPS